MKKYKFYRREKRIYKRSNSYFESDGIKIVPHSKRSQISIFIILAVVFVLVFSFLFFLRNNFFQGASFETNTIQSFVESCIEKEAGAIISQAGENGGFYIAPEPKTDSGIFMYYDGKNDLSPSQKGLEESLDYFLEERLFFCTKNFVDFPEYEIWQEEIKVNSKLANEKILFTVNYPLTIQKGADVVQLEKFSVAVPTRLGFYSSIAREIGSVQKNYPQGICLDCLLETALKYDVYIDMVDYDETTTVFIIKDEKAKFDETSELFLFAMQTGGEDETSV